MEEINMAGGLRGFLQTAGRALIVFKRAFFCVKEVSERDYKDEEQEDPQVENLLLSIEHFILS